MIIRPAGVAQSVERVALIFSDIPNLKVAGSSPAFGYSYTFAVISFCFFRSLHGVRVKIWKIFLLVAGRKPDLADRVSLKNLALCFVCVMHVMQCSSTNFEAEAIRRKT